MPPSASPARIAQATAQKLRRERLANQCITSSQVCAPAQVVAALGGLQAQDYASVLWSIGLRLARATRSDVEQALAQGSLVRSWALRGTLHVVPGEDLQWMLKLTGPRTLTARRRRAQQLDLTPRHFARAEQLVVKALRGRKAHTREALMAALQRAGMATAGQRGYHLLAHLGIAGVLCFGPVQGKSATFVLADEWLPVQRQPSADEARAILAARYFSSHGPATLQDFAGWAGIALRDAKEGFAGAQTQLREVTPGCWSVGCEPELARHSAQLLPGFDEYVLGYKDRSAILASEHAAKIVPGGNGVFLPTIVADGRVVGTWKSAVAKRGTRVALAPFIPLTLRTRSALARAAERYAAFVGSPVTVELARSPRA